MNTFYSNRVSLLLEFTASLDLKDEKVLETFSKQRRRLEWEIEDSYCRLRDSK